MALLSGAAGPAAATEPVRAETLPNGIWLVVAPEPRAPDVAVYVSEAIGRAVEPAERRGWSHLLAHLMYAGTDAVPDTFATLDQLGATFNSQSPPDHELLWTVAPRAELATVLWIESDRQRAALASVTAQDVDRERARVLDEVNLAGPESPTWAAREAARALYPEGHPERPFWETPEILAEATPDSVRAYVRGAWGPDRTTVVISGGVEADAAVRLATAAFGDLPARELPGVPVSASAPAGLAETLHVHREVPASGGRWAVLAFALPNGLPTPEIAVATALLDGPDGRLQRDLVVPGLADGAYVAPSSGTLYCIALAAAGQDPATVAARMDDAVWALFNERPPTDAEVERARALVLARSYESLSDADGRARWLLDVAHSCRERGADPSCIPATAKGWLTAIETAPPSAVLEAAWDALSRPHVVFDAEPVAP